MSDEIEEADKKAASTADKVASITAYVSILAATGTAIAAAAIWLGGTIESSVRPTGMTQSDRERVLLEFHKELSRIEAQQEALRSPDKLPPPLAVLDARLKQIEQKQGRIEQTIMSNPDRALELPLMRRDLETLQQRQTASADELRRSIELVFDLSMGLLGGIFVGFVALAINAFVRRKA
jgi:hypothetical protein